MYLVKELFVTYLVAAQHRLELQLDAKANPLGPEVTVVEAEQRIQRPARRDRTRGYARGVYLEVDCISRPLDVGPIDECISREQA